MATYEEIGALDQEIEALKRKRAELYRALPREEVGEYEFVRTNGGKVPLSALFGDKDDLLLIHNMGSFCAYCTLWADGFEGMRPHLESRVSFALISNDEPEDAAAFAKSRGWTFDVLSGRHTTFAKDMGFYVEGEGVYPGVSAFHRDPDGTIRRTGKAFFGPGDDYCPIWHFFELLEGGPGAWEPKVRY